MTYTDSDPYEDVPDEVLELRAENERLRAAIAELDPEGHHGDAAPAKAGTCKACHLPWPCPTRRAIDLTSR